MSSIINLVMTVFGFVVSAIFIVFVLIRLLCARLQTRSSRRRWAMGAAVDSVALERGANGMDPLVVALFPTIKYNREVFSSREDATCTVCLGEYEDTDSLRILPQCGHAFHVTCIDAWLRQQSTCPVCRLIMQNSPVRRNMPSPLLSEAARLRFSPGAIPESLFEQPLLFSNSPTTTTGECSPHQGGSLNSFPTYTSSPEVGEYVLQMPDAQQILVDLESSRHKDRLGSQDLELEQTDEEPENTSDGFVQGNMNFPLGQLRDLRRQKPGKYSFWLWRRWEKGELGVETSNAGMGEEGSEYGISEVSGDESIVEVEASSIPQNARLSFFYDATEVAGGGGVDRGSTLPYVGVNTERVEEQDANNFHRESIHKCYDDRTVELVDMQGAISLGESINQDRHSFSSWVSKTKEECMAESYRKVEGSCDRVEVDCRPEDIVLGWAPVTFLSTQCDSSEVRFKLDCRQPNASTKFETGIMDGTLDTG